MEIDFFLSRDRARVMQFLFAVLCLIEKPAKSMQNIFLYPLVGEQKFLFANFR